MHEESTEGLGGEHLVHGHRLGVTAVLNLSQDWVVVKADCRSTSDVVSCRVRP